MFSCVGFKQGLLSGFVYVLDLYKDCVLDISYICWIYTRIASWISCVGNEDMIPTPNWPRVIKQALLVPFIRYVSPFWLKTLVAESRSWKPWLVKP